MVVVRRRRLSLAINSLAIALRRFYTKNHHSGVFHLCGIFAGRSPMTDDGSSDHAAGSAGARHRRWILRRISK